MFALCSLVNPNLFSPGILVTGRGGAVPIYRLFDGQAFEPEQVTILAQAFEELLPLLGLTDREDQVTLLVARRVIELAQTGVRDPVRLR
jgi:hypothetical protein